MKSYGPGDQISPMTEKPNFLNSPAILVAVISSLLLRNGDAITLNL